MTPGGGGRGGGRIWSRLPAESAAAAEWWESRPTPARRPSAEFQSEARRGLRRAPSRRAERTRRCCSGDSRRPRCLPPGVLRPERLPAGPECAVGPVSGAPHAGREPALRLGVWGACWDLGAPGTSTGCFASAQIRVRAGTGGPLDPREVVGVRRPACSAACLGGGAHSPPGYPPAGSGSSQAFLAVGSRLCCF